MKTWWITNEFWPKANEQHYAFKFKPSEKDYGKTFEVVMKSELDSANEALKIAVEALGKTKAAMTYAYEDHSDQYYLNVKEDMEEVLAEIRRLRGEG